MTSVVFDRLSVFAFLTAWGVVFPRMTDPLDRFWLVQMDSFIWQCIQGWLAAPLLLAFQMTSTRPDLSYGPGPLAMLVDAK